MNLGEFILLIGLLCVLYWVLPFIFVAFGVLFLVWGAIYLVCAFADMVANLIKEARHSTRQPAA